MAENCVNIRFRMNDGTDLGPNLYDVSLTIQNLKEKILAEWPTESGKDAPRSIQDLRLIHAGHIIENCKMLSEQKLAVGKPETVVTMHLVVTPPAVPKAQDTTQKETEKQSRCGSCLIA